MDKKYQIFVSSTFVDLKEERQAVLTAVQEADDIPSGMEMFPATDEEQFNFIKRIIDNCDYYVVIIAGRYGSIAPDGKSYTEKEYDYAVENGIPVLAFVRNDDAIEEKDKDTESVKIQKLAQFKSKVQTGRIVRMWNQKQDLIYSVIISLTKVKKEHPAVGWVRANQVMSNESLVELSNLRKEVAELRDYKRKQESSVNYENIADFDDEINLRFIHSYWEKGYGDIQNPRNMVQTWRSIFAQISPTIFQNPNEELLKIKIGAIYKSKIGLPVGKLELKNEDFETIKIQLIAYGLVEVKYLQAINGSYAWFWNLTPKGKKEMMENRVVRKK